MVKLGRWLLIAIINKQYITVKFYLFHEIKINFPCLYTCMQFILMMYLMIQVCGLIQFTRGLKNLKICLKFLAFLPELALWNWVKFIIHITGRHQRIPRNVIVSSQQPRYSTPLGRIRISLMSTPYIQHRVYEFKSTRAKLPFGIKNPNIITTLRHRCRHLNKKLHFGVIPIATLQVYTEIQTISISNTNACLRLYLYCK